MPDNPREYYQRVGRLGGYARAWRLGKRRRRQIAKQGGLASLAGRLEKMSPEQRTAIARNAARARWAKASEQPGS
jgi:general stress protein YciG